MTAALKQIYIEFPLSLLVLLSMSVFSVISSRSSIFPENSVVKSTNETLPVQWILPVACSDSPGPTRTAAAIESSVPECKTCRWRMLIGRKESTMGIIILITICSRPMQACTARIRTGLALQTAITCLNNLRSKCLCTSKFCASKPPKTREVQKMWAQSMLQSKEKQNRFYKNVTPWTASLTFKLNTMTAPNLCAAMVCARRWNT